MTSIRPGLPEDGPGMRELFALCHERELPADLWDWRYRGGPEGGALIDVAVDDGRVVGHLAALPVRLERGERTLAAALWVDLMVHPAHRNLDVFLEMAEANRAHCAAAGRELLFAFPNDRSFPLLKRMLDWHAVEDVAALEAPLSGLAQPGPPASGWQVATGLEPAPEFDAFWEEVRPREAWAVRRGQARLAWRYLAKPRAGYGFWTARDETGRLRGWLAAKVFAGAPGPVGDILDFWVAAGAEPALCGLWGAALGHFRKHAVLTVSAWALRGTPWFTRYQELGLGPCGPITHFAGRRTSSGGAAAFPGLGRDWHIAKGDSDVF
ncbi:MAG: GNAT family N-acetyltransferase [Elusimicrobia bacterium]|nr:GNAT family N-acetyltransferase [Elusimicrobiota bacterium]